MSDENGTPPIKLSREDLLIAENLSLKMIHVQQQMQQLQAHVQQELVRMNQDRAQFQKEFEAHRAHCKTAYGVDIVEVELSNDGTVLGPKAKNDQVSPPIQPNR